MKTKIALLVCFLANMLLAASGANRVIAGLVISSEDEQPLIGASVYANAADLKKVGMTSLGTITDIDGKFTLSVPEQITRLYCSYIGYEEVVIQLDRNKKNYHIRLKPATQMLEGVVVTGYQTLERRRLTAAISKVDVSDAVIGASKSIDQALAGQIAGVSVTNTSGAPGAPARIRIRGTASLNGTQDPLWVLDGMPLEGTDIPKLQDGNDNDITNIGQSSIAGISPNDIESITILKDAAATAIYGARAANGVIVITTKKGRTGKPVINFNSKWTYAPNLNISRLNLLNAEDKVNLELQLMKETYDLWGDIYPSYAQKGGVSTILKKYRLTDAYRSEGWDALTPEVKNEIERLKTIQTDWNDILFRDAFTQEYNLSLSGGSDKVTYYNSIGYSNENGNIPGVSMARFNLTSKTFYQANKLLKLGISIFANRRKNLSFVTDQYGLSNPIFYSRTANPYFEPFDSNHHYNYDYDIVSGNESDQKQGFNIFEERSNTKNETVTTSLNSIFDAELRFNDNWKLSSQIGLQWDNSEHEQTIGEQTFNVRYLRERSIYSGKYLIPEGGVLKYANSTTAQITWKTQGELKKTFGRFHDLQLMAGTEIRKNWFNNHAMTTYGFDGKTLTNQNIVFKDEKQALDYNLMGKNYIENVFASFYANGSYSYHDRYTLGASVRMDGSDLFGVDKKYRYLPIYSLSALWRVSKEDFLASAKWLDNLALRMSYGLQGNIDKGTSPFLVGQYEKSSLLPGYNEDVIEILSAPNSKLRWEKTSSYNFGIDYAMLNQAVNLSVDYYYRKGTDLIGTKMLPLENGFSSMTINWASMENKGVEVNLQTRNLATKNFSWYTNFNFAYNQNKVLEVTTPENQTTPGIKGYPVGAIFALKTQGIDPETGRIQLVTKDGKTTTFEEMFKLVDEFGIGFYASGVTPEEQRSFYSYMGTSDAPYSGGFMNTFNYRNWELNVNFAYYMGAKVKTAPTYNAVDLDPGKNTNRDILDRWTPENKQGTFPALITRNNFPADYNLLSEQNALYRSLDIWVKPLNYIRLQNVRLAYRMPTEWLRSLSVKGAILAIEGRNLFVFGSSYKNYMDPESMSNIYATPIPKSLTFNLNLTF